jgi:hypothetical protein
MAAVVLCPFADDFQNIVSGNNLGNVGSPAIAAYVPSPYGFALNATNEKYVTGTVQSFNTGDFTIEGSGQTAASGSRFVLFSSQISSSDAFGVTITINANNKVALAIGASDWVGNTTVAAATKFHLRFVFSGGNKIRAYLNGALELDISVNYSISNNTYNVGRIIQFPTSSVSMTIFDFAIYNTALNSGNFTPPTVLAGKFQTTFADFGESEVIDYQVAADTRTITDTFTGNGTDSTLYRFVVGDAFTLSVTSGQTPTITGSPGTVSFLNEVTVTNAVAVPDSTGNTVAEYELELAAVGLLLGTESEAFSETVPVGVIISTDPAAGTEVAVGSSVDVVVSLGPESATLPNYIREKLAESITAVEAIGFTATTPSKAYSIAIPKGRICGQIPNAGEVNMSVEIQFAESIGKTTQTDTLFQHTAAVMHFNGNIVDSLGTLWDDDSDEGAEVTFSATGAAFSGLAMQMNPSGAAVSRVVAGSKANYIPAGRDFCPEVLLYFPNLATENTFRLGFFETAKAVWYIKVVQVSAPVNETMTPAVYGASLVISASGAAAGEFESTTITFSAETVTHLAFTLHQSRVYSFLNGALIARERCLAAPFETDPGEFAIESGIVCNVGGFRLTNGYPRYLSAFDRPVDIFPVNQGRESINGWQYNSVSARANTVTSYTDGETVIRKS